MRLRLVSVLAGTLYANVTAAQEQAPKDTAWWLGAGVEAGSGLALRPIDWSALANIGLYHRFLPAFECYAEFEVGTRLDTPVRAVGVGSGLLYDGWLRLGGVAGFERRDGASTVQLPVQGELGLSVPFTQALSTELVLSHGRDFGPGGTAFTGVALSLDLGVEL